MYGEKRLTKGKGEQIGLALSEVSDKYARKGRRLTKEAKRLTAANIKEYYFEASKKSMKKGASVDEDGEEKESDPILTNISTALE